MYNRLMPALKQLYEISFVIEISKKSCKFFLPAPVSKASWELTKKV
jgi:hypothetical protein